MPGIIPPEPFGIMADGTLVQRVQIGSTGVRATVIGYGAALQRIEVPDHAGTWRNVALGLETLAEYETRSPHFGAVAGRYAGRIAMGRFTLDGRTYQIPPRHGPHAIHGGNQGFGKHGWSLAAHRADQATFTLHSPDGDEGFPGALDVQVTYIAQGTDLRIEYRAETTAPTVLNLTNHSYFNLEGEGSGDILGHILTIDADRFLPCDAEAIPIGEFRSVAGTPFDFRAPSAIGARIRDADPQLLHVSGYDHAYLLPGTGLRRAARVEAPHSGRWMEVLTTEPALHLYTGNNLTGTLAGPGGRAYRQSDGVCFETERPQDSPNQPDFPSTVLRPGTPFTSTTIFRFGVAGS